MKTTVTNSIEKALWKHTSKLGTFGCFEVSIGFNAEIEASEKNEVKTYRGGSNLGD